MPHLKRKSSSYGKNPRQRGNLIVLAVVLVLLAAGLVLLLRGMSFNGESN